MDYIEEILNLRELVTRLSNRVAALEGSSSKKIELVKCSKCGVERHPLFKRQCLDPECEGGLTIGACPPKSLMTSEPCHGLDIKNIELVTGKQWGEFKSNTCKKCGIELNQIMGYVCPNSDCPTGMGPSTCSSMTSEPCHGLILEDVQFSNVNCKDIEEYKREMENLSQYWRDNPDKAPKY